MKPRTPQPLRILVVLGGTNARNGRLSSMSARRLRRALALFRARPAGAYLVLTGGFGAHFNTTRRPHWAYARDWLRRHGVTDDRFLAFVDSTNTRDDARLAAAVLARFPAASLTLVTSDFHLARARYLFRRQLGRRRLAAHASACLASFAPARRARLVAHERTQLARYRAEERAARD